MTARPPIAQFGDAIEVKGERPSWLPDGAVIQYRHRIDPEGYWGKGPANYSRWDALDWECVTAIRLEVPRYDFVYLALERGMVPWFGGDEAPGDWDGQAALLRNGCVVPSVYRWAIGYPADGPKEATGPIGTDVIGYTRKATSTALPIAHPAAPQGEEGRLREALKQIAYLRPAGDVERCVGAKKLVAQIERIALAALAPAAIVSGRGEGE